MFNGIQYNTAQYNSMIGSAVLTPAKDLVIYLDITDKRMYNRDRILKDKIVKNAYQDNQILKDKRYKNTHDVL